MTERRIEEKKGNHPKKIQIPVIQITLGAKKKVLDVEGKVVEEAHELRETEWLATTVPLKPLRVTECIEANGLNSEASASIGKKRRKRKSNLSSP